MRQHKYRAKGATVDQLLYGWGIFTDQSDRIYLIADDRDFILVERDTVGQFTGLKDKNGKDIYEGDIIEHWDERYIIPNFTPLDRSYQAENIKEHSDGSDDWMSMSNVDWEVIGNIHENKDLFK